MPHSDSVLEVLNEECPYDMIPGEYWVLLRELWEGTRKPTVIITTQLVFANNEWYVASTTSYFAPS